MRLLFDFYLLLDTETAILPRHYLHERLEVLAPDAFGEQILERLNWLGQPISHAHHLK